MHILSHYINFLFIGLSHLGDMILIVKLLLLLFFSSIYAFCVLPKLFATISIILRNMLPCFLGFIIVFPV